MSWTSREIEQARAMRAAGASYESIAERWGVCRSRVMYALDPEFAARERERARKNSQGFKVTGAMVRRMIELAEAGVSYEGIGRAMGVYHRRPVSASTVQKYMRRHAPELRRKPRGVAFGSDRNPRVAA